MSDWVSGSEIGEAVTKVAVPYETSELDHGLRRFGRTFFWVAIFRVEILTLVESESYDNGLQKLVYDFVR